MIIPIKLFDAVLFVEFINTTARIHKLLFPSVEGVALGADFNGDILLGAAGFVNCAACAFNNCGFIVGMDAFLHDVHSYHRLP